MFIGPTFPENVIGIGSTLTLWDRLSIDGLGEFQRGGYNINYVGFQNENRGNWFPCFDIQRKLAAAIKSNTQVTDVRAIDQARCSLDRTAQYADVWTEKTDFFRLRYVTVTYKIPSRFVRGVEGASLTLGGRNLFYSSKYTGLDPESSDQADSQVGRREYYVLPQLRSYSLALRMNW
jgi:hypothetical protein